MVKGPNILELLRNVKRSGFLRHTHGVCWYNRNNTCSLQQRYYWCQLQSTAMIAFHNDDDDDAKRLLRGLATTCRRLHYPMHLVCLSVRSFRAGT